MIVLQKNKVLVIKNWFGAGYWQLPGGGIKIGESVKDAATRELREELFLEAKNPVLLHAEPKVVRQSGLLMRYHFVLVDIDNTKNEFRTGSLITDAKWLDKTHLSGVAQEVLEGLDLVSQQG